MRLIWLYIVLLIHDLSDFHTIELILQLDHVKSPMEGDVTIIYGYVHTPCVAANSIVRANMYKKSVGGQQHA